MGDGVRLAAGMAKTLSADKVLVKARIDESLSHVQACDVADLSTLAERMQWVLEYLSKTEGKNVSARELARRAGLNSEASVGHIIRGIVKRPSADVLGSIARAAGVSFDWLNDNKGEPVAASVRTTATDRVHPVIAEVGKAEGFSDAEMAAATAMIAGVKGTADMTQEQALDHLETVRGARRRQERSAFNSIVRDKGASALDELSGGRGGSSKRRR